MRPAFYKLFFIAASGLLPAFGSVVAQTLPLEPAGKLLVDKFGDFSATSAVVPQPEVIPEITEFSQSAASRSYTSKDGRRFNLTIITTGSEAGAYALLTSTKRSLEKVTQFNGVSGDVGTESFVSPPRLLFAKGRSYVAITSDYQAAETQPLIEIGKAFAAKLDAGESDVPALVKHLPDWPNVRGRAFYAVTHSSLKKAFPNQPIIDVVTFDGREEAAMADYGQSQLVIVEFNTPQLATDNNQRIAARIQELRNQGQPTPTAYRRVGNYSVFVFDAPNEQAANQLIDQVKYQQVVQWLGRNPHLYDRAANEFTQTTLGVFIAVVKASGLAIIGSLALGGVLGALLFSRRRKQQRVVAYSDAGGMLRLNLDEMTAQRDPARLLGPGS